MHQKRTWRILGILKKFVELSLVVWRRRVTFASSQWPCGGWGGGKASLERLCLSLSLCWKTFKLEGNKKFRTWTKKSWSVFCVLGFLCSVYICYEHSMYISHIFMYGYVTLIPLRKAWRLLSSPTSYGLNSSITVHLLIDMPLNKESKQVLPLSLCLGGAHGVMVIVTGNGHSDTSSNPMPTHTSPEKFIISCRQIHIHYSDMHTYL